MINCQAVKVRSVFGLKKDGLNKYTNRKCYFSVYRSIRHPNSGSFIRLGKETYNLLDKLLTLNPRERITASEALDDEYFWSDPLPADPKRQVPLLVMTEMSKPFFKACQLTKHPMNMINVGGGNNIKISLLNLIFLQSTPACRLRYIILKGTTFVLITSVDLRSHISSLYLECQTGTSRLMYLFRINPGIGT